MSVQLGDRVSFAVGPVSHYLLGRDVPDNGVKGTVLGFASGHEPWSRVNSARAHIHCYVEFEGGPYKMALDGKETPIEAPGKEAPVGAVGRCFFVRLDQIQVICCKQFEQYGGSSHSLGCRHRQMHKGGNPIQGSGVATLPDMHKSKRKGVPCDTSSYYDLLPDADGGKDWLEDLMDRDRYAKRYYARKV